MVTTTGGEDMSTEGETPSFCPTLQVLDMSPPGDAADVNPVIKFLPHTLHTQNAFLSTVHAMFRHDCPLAVKPASTPRRLLPRKTWKHSLPIDTLLSVVSVLVVALPSSQVPDGLMNHPVCGGHL
jgi:hypothetical protein